ncbi:inorganic pyrophosphatase [Candidatus Woesebacteria bacterium]|nr:inorganic pyrophosphatase [Candidatus Woesebacteria bacterium]
MDEKELKKFAKEFWEGIEELVDESKIVVDRPKNSAHPRFPDMIYPVDYGYLENTSSMDGGGIDVWVRTKKKKAVDAIVCNIDRLKKDSEIKILFGCNEKEKELIYKFYKFMNNSKYTSAILIDRKDI